MRLVDDFWPNSVRPVRVAETESGPVGVSLARRYWVAGGNGNWNSTTNWSLTDGGASGASVPTAAISAFFTALSGSGTSTVNAASACRDLNFTGFTGTWAGASTLAISGSLTMSAGMTRSYTGAITFNDTSGTVQNITSNTITFASSFTFNGVGGKWAFVDAFSTTGAITPTNGEIDVSGATTMQCSSMVCAAGTKKITFGNVVWTITGTGTSWSNQQLANYTQSLGGSSKIKFTGGAGATAIDWSGSLDDVEINGGTGGWSMAARTPTFRDLLLTNTGAGNVTLASVNLRNLTCTGFAGTLTLGAISVACTGDVTFSAGMSFSGTTAVLACQNLDFGSFAGTWSGSGLYTVSKSLTFSASMICTHTGGIVMNDTSGTTRTITSNGIALTDSIQFNGAGGVWQLADDLSLPSTGVLTLTQGTFKTNGKNVLVGAISTSNSNTRTFDMTGSRVTIYGAGGTLWSGNVSTNLTVTYDSASKLLFSNSTGVNGTFSFGVLANWPDIEFGGIGSGSLDISSSSGTLSCTNLTVSNTGGAQFKNAGILRPTNLTFTAAYTGTVPSSSNTWIIDGSLTMSASMTYSRTGALTFSGTGTITSNGISFGHSINFNGTGTYTLADAFTLTGTLFVSSGGFVSAGKAITCPAFASATGSVRTVNLSGSSVTINGTGGWNTSTTTNLTWTAPALITMTDSSSSGKTFDGGALTFNALTFSGTGTGAFTVNGSNTFTTITILNPPHTVLFQVTTTTTLAELVSVGTAGNLNTIKSNGAGTRATLSKSMNRTAQIDYTHFQDLNFRGGALWYLGQNAVNDGNTNGGRWMGSSWRYASGDTPYAA